MHIEDFMGIAKDFSDLGWSVQEQLQAILDGEDFDDQNINALFHINTFFTRAKDVGIEFPDMQPEALLEYLQENG